MAESSQSVVPTILLAQEDAEARASFSALILDFFPTAKIEAIETWEALEPTLANSPTASTLLVDILWSEEDRADQVLLLAEKFPQISFAVFGRYELSGSLPPGYPVPLLAPDEGLPLRLSEIMENLSGQEAGPYHILSPAGPHTLGRLYGGKHHQLERSVQLLVPPSGSPVFPKAIRAMARVNHPSVYSLYESIPWESRILVAQEPAVHPSLLHLRLSGQKPGLLPCARLATCLGSVLAEMESSSIPARLLGEYDYTLSPKGTPRLRNPAAYPGQPESSSYDNAQQLAAILEPLLAGQPKSAPLLQILRHPGTSAFDLLRQAREFERQLADVREVHVRKEELEAVAKTLRARVLRRWAIGIGAAALLVYLGIFARTIFDKFFFDAPATLAEAELPVPAGQVTLGGKTTEIPAFFLDRHEVTIGDYEKFLAALREKPDWLLFVPEAYRPMKKSPADLQPLDWAEMLRCARKNDAYEKQKISRDTPVFNVDFASAAAYAAWKGRRLPTRQEWMFAATGRDARPYPWGTEKNPPGVNLLPNAPDRRAKDSDYFHVLPAESSPGDVGPLGHRDLGGNLSEWVLPAPQEAGFHPFLGGNFMDEAPVGNTESPRYLKAGEKDPRIGFRTAR